MSLLNHSNVKKLLLELSKTTRNGKFTRVSGEVFEWLEGEVKAKCAALIRSHATVGKTVYPPCRLRKDGEERAEP